MHTSLDVPDEMNILIQRDGHGLFSSDDGFLVKLIMFRPDRAI